MPTGVWKTGPIGEVFLARNAQRQYQMRRIILRESEMVKRDLFKIVICNAAIKPPKVNK